MPNYTFINGRGPFDVRLSYLEYDIFSRVLRAYVECATLKLESLQELDPSILPTDIPFLEKKDLIHGDTLAQRVVDSAEFILKGPGFYSTDNGQSEQ